jgi:hypothetical protein
MQVLLLRVADKFVPYEPRESFPYGQSDNQLLVAIVLSIVLVGAKPQPESSQNLKSHLEL